MVYAGGTNTKMRLKSLAAKCGVSEAGNQPAEAVVDTSKMSAYEKQQFKLASNMQTVRQNIMELDNLGDNASTTRKAELGNAIRKDLASMKKDAVEARKLAHEEKKKGDYETLLGHLKKTDELYKARFATKDDQSAGLASGRKHRGVTQLDDEMSDLSHPMVNLREDEEFQVFFQQTRANDQKMDQALDRLSVGVDVLHQNAIAINEELKTQKELLTTMETKVDKVHGDLKTLNKRVLKTIKEVEKDKMCMYVICFIMVLALAGAVYWQLSGSSSKDK